MKKSPAGGETFSEISLKTTFCVIDFFEKFVKFF